jgi:predicted ATPase
LRKLAMLAYLLINGALRGRSTVFWDEPETNLNPKLMVSLAQALVELAEQGYQVMLATHSLFMLREIELAQMQRRARVPARYIGLALQGETVVVEQGNDVAGIQTLILLDEELNQSDRYLAQGEPNV